ncbi:hypothetical protein HY604_00605 [Candidatus Peregrinibacteria bacterium]|nr:hypothetical protein [Candidatus Peregrinibacteria bacterium]
MNQREVKNAVKHLQKTCTCQCCKQKFDAEEIEVVATTQFEGLFELHCPKCKLSAVVTVVITPEFETLHRVSQNDILDVKNFLSKFDGNFKRAFNYKES